MAITACLTLGGTVVTGAGEPDETIKQLGRWDTLIVCRTQKLVGGSGDGVAPTWFRKR